MELDWAKKIVWVKKKVGPKKRQTMHHATDPETGETSGWEYCRRKCLEALAKKRRTHAKAS